MTRLLPILFAVFCAIPAARGATLGEQSGINATLGIAPTTTDFVREAAVGGQFAIESSALAAKRTTGPTRQFAESLVRDRTRMADELKKLAGTAKIDLPTTLDEAHRQALGHLAGLRGDAFDLAYHSEQDAKHQRVVSLFKRYAKGGENAALKTWAGEMLPQLEANLATAKALDK